MLFEDLLAAAILQHQRGELDAVEQSYKALLSMRPDAWVVLSNLGVLYLQRYQLRNDLEQLAVGISYLQKSVEINPIQPNTQKNLAIAYLRQSNMDLARHHYQLTVMQGGATLEFHMLLGASLLDAGFAAESLSAFDHAIALSPGTANAWYNRGNALRLLHRHEEAMSAYRRCLRLEPEHVEALINTGVLLQDLKQFETALIYYDRALSLRQDSLTAAYNRGLVLENLQQLQAAIDAYQALLQLKPDYPYLLGRLHHAQMQNCDWRCYEASMDGLKGRVLRQERVMLPFAFLAVTDNLLLQSRCANVFTSDKFPMGHQVQDYVEDDRSTRLRIGYFSSDLKTHALAFLTVGLFECHDRQSFEIFAFSSGYADEGDVYRQRIAAGCEHFIDTSGMTDADVIVLARSLRLDIAVDLAGHTLDARTGVFAQRVAPAQISYLGYPGSMAAPYIDYILADERVIPVDYDSLYSEKVVRLPSCFQVNDQRRLIAEVSERETFGLPAAGIVLASFNTSYKINPVMFDAWCRILKTCPNALLWLLAESADQMNNLKKEAMSRGVDPERLVFAGRLSYPAHLARYAHVDLVLDTFPFNGGTSTSDALWGGAPVITCTGEAFASRMSASLLYALGLPELINDTIEKYEACAIDLVSHADRLKVLRQRLAINRMNAPLFDTQKITRDIEAAYLKIVRKTDSNDSENLALS